MKNILISFAAVFLLAGCEKEEDLTPTNIEVDWHDYLDMSNPIVKQMYDECQVGLLTDFDLNRDMLNNSTSYWEMLRMDKFETSTGIDSAFVFLQETFLSYFTNKSFIRDYFPRKIILTRELLLNYVITTNLGNPYSSIIEESDLRVSSQATGSLHSIFNKVAFAFSMKFSSIFYESESEPGIFPNYNGYVLDNMYIFLSALFDRNNFYDAFGADFYLPEMVYCYGKAMSQTPTALNDYTPGIWQEDGGDPSDASAADKYWVWNKGFVSTRFSLAVNANDEITLRNAGGSASFPSKERDVRNLLNQMIFVTEELWDSYPDPVKDRFAVMMTKFDEWGIDIRRLNPTMAYAFPR